MFPFNHHQFDQNVHFYSCPHSLTKSLQSYLLCCLNQLVDLLWSKNISDLKNYKQLWPELLISRPSLFKVTFA